MSSLGEKTVSEINEAIAAEVAKVNADYDKFSGGTSAAGRRMRASYMDIMKLCKVGRKTVLDANNAAKEARKANPKTQKVPKRQLK